MEGVNLVLEEEMMYLVLGAPGCGKSTCKLFHLCFVGMITSKKLFFPFRLRVLKMIADCLFEDTST